MLAGIGRSKHRQTSSENVMMMMMMLLLLMMMMMMMATMVMLMLMMKMTMMVMTTKMMMMMMVMVVVVAVVVVVMMMATMVMLMLMMKIVMIVMTTRMTMMMMMMMVVVVVVVTAMRKEPKELEATSRAPLYLFLVSKPAGRCRTSSKWDHVRCASSVAFLVDVRHEAHEGPRGDAGQSEMEGPVEGHVECLGIRERHDCDAILRCSGHGLRILTSLVTEMRVVARRGHRAGPNRKARQDGASSPPPPPPPPPIPLKHTHIHTWSRRHENAGTETEIHRHVPLQQSTQSMRGIQES